MCAVALPLSPPLAPQLARSAKDLPSGDGWRYEPKWDGFRTIVFRDGDEVHLQSRGGKPMNRYFPEVVEQVRAMPADGVVLDGEIVVEVDGVQQFDLLSQRIHPAESRVLMLAERTPARYIAFDALAVGGASLLERGYDARRAALDALDLGPVEVSPSLSDAAGARVWLTGHWEGVVAKEGAAPYLPGERRGMVKVKRRRTADMVVVAFRWGKAEGTVGSLILGLHDESGELRVVGHTSGFSAAQKRELTGLLEPYRTHESGSGGPTRWKPAEELEWEGLRPELVCEISYDHVSGGRIRHGTTFLRWRDDKAPAECTMDQLSA